MIGVISWFLEQTLTNIFATYLHSEQDIADQSRIVHENAWSLYNRDFSFLSGLQLKPLSSHLGRLTAIHNFVIMFIFYSSPIQWV